MIPWGFTFFVDRSDRAAIHVRKDEYSAYPFSVSITPSPYKWDERPSIDIHFADESAFINFINSARQSYANMRRKS